MARAHFLCVFADRIAFPGDGFDTASWFVISVGEEIVNDGGEGLLLLLMEVCKCSVSNEGSIAKVVGEGRP